MDKIRVVTRRESAAPVAPPHQADVQYSPRSRSSAAPLDRHHASVFAIGCRRQGIGDRRRLLCDARGAREHPASVSMSPRGCSTSVACTLQRTDAYDALSHALSVRDALATKKRHSGLSVDQLNRGGAATRAGVRWCVHARANSCARSRSQPRETGATFGAHAKHRGVEVSCCIYLSIVLCVCGLARQYADARPRAREPRNVYILELGLLDPGRDSRAASPWPPSRRATRRRVSSTRPRSSARPSSGSTARCALAPS